ncbi:MAG: RNB domain-containing ribonuclease, partial [Flavobacteriaceae bacterium]
MNNKRLNTLKIIQSIFENNPQRKWNFRQILKRIPFLVPEKEVKFLLEQLCSEKKIVLINPGSYTLNKIIKKEQGIVDKTSSGNAYLIQENVEKDIYVREKNTLNSFNGDLVEFKLISLNEGIITKVIKRNKKKFVGLVNKEKNKIYVKTLSNRDKITFIITNKKEFKLKEKDIVVVDFTKWEDILPEAKIVERIGESGVTENEIHAILEEFQLPYKFNKEVKYEADKLNNKNYTKEYLKRKDLRKITTLTIDPDDAKDFDDAISLETLDKVNRVGVHIADVSFFLKKGSKLDKEAYERGTSVYLVDRVVPMLPEQLSNELCSLKPEEDKLTFSVVFDFNNKNELIKFWAGRTVINSDKRLSYKEAQYIISEKENIIPKNISLNNKEKKVNKKIKNTILVLNDLAKELRKRREKNGSIFFNKKEVRFVLNEDKNPTHTFIKQSTESNQLVEEFMLLANKKVAEIF